MYSAMRRAFNPIRLPALQSAHHGRIHQCEMEPALAGFEHIPHRNPVNAGGFHGDFSHLAFPQPFPQTHQILRESSENRFFDFDFRLAANPAPDTNADRLLVDVETSATAVK
jgi:hypothetical protein